MILSPNTGGGTGHQRRQIQRQVFFDQHADHAQRMAAQRKRVLVAGRQVADAEHADQRFELVGQRDDHADRVARQLVAGKARLVMVFNRVGHLGAQAVIERVVAAHDALQFGELAHHVGHQIGLGQLRGLIGLRGQRVAAKLLADRLGNRAHALHALALRAQLVVINHLVQPRHARGQRLLAVLVEEELGIGQARAHHALVAADHRAGVFRADVADDEELVASACRRRRAAESISGSPSSSGSGIPAARRGTLFQTRRPAHWGARPARSLRRAARRLQSAARRRPASAAASASWRAISALRWAKLAITAPSISSVTA